MGVWPTTVKARRGAMEDPTASWEHWIFWKGRWEHRGSGYGSEPSMAGYGHYDPDKQEFRFPQDYDGELPEWLEWWS